MDDKTLNMLRAIGHPKGVEIFLMLLRTDSLTPTVIANRMEISLPALSYHLNKMCKAGVLISVPVSRYRSYLVNVDALKTLKEFFEKVEEDLRKKGNLNG